MIEDFPALGFFRREYLRDIRHYIARSEMETIFLRSVPIEARYSIWVSADRPKRARDDELPSTPSKNKNYFGAGGRFGTGGGRSADANRPGCSSE
jgi:hypothetical protein